MALASVQLLHSALALAESGYQQALATVKRASGATPAKPEPSARAAITPPRRCRASRCRRTPLPFHEVAVSRTCPCKSGCWVSAPVSITATVTPRPVRGDAPDRAVGKRGIGSPARPVALEQPIRLHQLDTRIALQASDQGFERLVGRHLITPALHLDRSRGIFPPVADDIGWPGPGRWGPLRLEPLGQGHDDLPGLQLLGHAGFGDGSRRFVFRDGAAAGRIRHKV